MKQDLPTRSCLGHFPTEFGSRGAQFIDPAIEIIRHDHEAVTPAWLRITARLASATRPRHIDEEMHVAERQRCELVRIVLLDGESEAVTIERDSFINVVHDAAHNAKVRLCGPLAWRARPDFTCFQAGTEVAAIRRGVTAELGDLTNTQPKPDVGPFAPAAR